MRITCQCGELTYLEEFPDHNRGVIYSDEQRQGLAMLIAEKYRKFGASPADFEDEIEDVFFSSSDHRIWFFECPHCRRLLVLRGPHLKLSYKPEDVPPQPQGAPAVSLADLLRETSTKSREDADSR